MPDIVDYNALVAVSTVTPVCTAIVVYGFIVMLLAKRGRTIASPSNIISDDDDNHRTLSWSTIKSFIARDFMVFLFGLFLSHGVSLTILICLKTWVGRLRPDFKARCVLLIDGKCTGDPKKVMEGRMSFPSGHSSDAFSGIVFLSLFLSHIWSRVFDVDAGTDFWFMGPAARSWRLLLPLPPILLAAYAAISRIQQGVHHPTDVLAGSLLGAIVAYASYRFYHSARLPNPRRQ